jgi:hypothetical protein
MLERGEIGPTHAWMLAETAVKIGLPRNEAESTIRSALGRIDGSTITFPTPTPPPGQLVVPETGELIDAPAPRNGPAFEKIPRSLIHAGLSEGELALLVMVWLGRDYRTGVYRTSGRALAKTCGCHPSTIWRRLNALEQAEWVERAATQGRGGDTAIRLGKAVRAL